MLENDSGSEIYLTALQKVTQSGRNLAQCGDIGLHQGSSRMIGWNNQIMHGVALNLEVSIMDTILVPGFV
jgi:hypothetical protein